MAAEPLSSLSARRVFTSGATLVFRLAIASELLLTFITRFLASFVKSSWFLRRN